MDGHEVRRVRAGEWRLARDLRLAALRDPIAHLAFLETLEQATARPDEQWRRRIVDAAASDRVGQFVAVAGTELVGSVAVLVVPAGERDYTGAVADHVRAVLVGVFVRPEHRGTGLLGELVGVAAGWAAEHGTDALVLDVNEGNLPARAAYRKVGFVETGEVSELGTGPELRMVRQH